MLQHILGDFSDETLNSMELKVKTACSTIITSFCMCVLWCRYLVFPQLLYSHGRVFPLGPHCGLLKIIVFIWLKSNSFMIGCPYWGHAACTGEGFSLLSSLALIFILSESQKNDAELWGAGDKYGQSLLWCEKEDRSECEGLGNCGGNGLILCCFQTWIEKSVALFSVCIPTLHYQFLPNCVFVHVLMFGQNCVNEHNVTEWTVAVLYTKFCIEKEWKNVYLSCTKNRPLCSSVNRKDFHLL